MTPKQKYAFAIALGLLWSDRLKELGVFESDIEAIKALELDPSDLTDTERSEIFQALC